MQFYGIQEGWDLEKIAVYCNCAGGLVVTKQGSIGRALPSLEEVEQMANAAAFDIEVKNW